MKKKHSTGEIYLTARYYEEQADVIHLKMIWYIMDWTTQTHIWLRCRDSTIIC